MTLISLILYCECIGGSDLSLEEIVWSAKGEFSLAVAVGVLAMLTLEFVALSLSDILKQSGKASETSPTVKRDG